MPWTSVEPQSLGCRAALSLAWRSASLVLSADDRHASERNWQKVSRDDGERASSSNLFYQRRLRGKLRHGHRPCRGRPAAALRARLLGRRGERAAVQAARVWQASQQVRKHSQQCSTEISNRRETLLSSAAPAPAARRAGPPAARRRPRALGPPAAAAKWEGPSRGPPATRLGSPRSIAGAACNAF